MSGPGVTTLEAGLTSEQATERLRTYGPNSVSARQTPSLLVWLGKLWGPVPWMLEAALVLELALGRYSQGGIIAALLLLNATVSAAQEGRARRVLALLKSRLEILARARRDGAWGAVPAERLVPGDLIHVRAGDFVPADLRLTDGAISLDQSALTGESVPVEAGPGAPALSGSVVRRGEARGVVTETGARTVYGRTAELVHAARSPSHLEAVVVGVVRYLVAFVALLVIGVLVCTAIYRLPWAEVATFALILLVAAVPVALPATYTLIGAVGALELSRRGVLVTRLAAIEDAAAVEVVCADKTGTLTDNRLTVTDLHPVPPHEPDDLIRAAALACDEATQDPLDLAVLAEVRRRGLPDGAGKRVTFIPFDPATKRAEALVLKEGSVVRMVKGAPAAVAGMVTPPPDFDANVEKLAGAGSRVLAVAAGAPGSLALLGLIAFRDPPRADAAAVVHELASLGVRVVMVTGDGPATAKAVAAEVGVTGQVCPPDRLHSASPVPLDYGVYAGVYPEDKFRLVKAHQGAGTVVGMTGDGVNDAPALRQAELGVAVTGAVDVAKAAAGVVLTRPGLGGLVDAVRAGREAYQRMLTYTLNKIAKTIQISLLLAGGLVLTGEFVTTPRLILLLLFANDFMTMSLATDRVRPSPRPDRWDVWGIIAVGFGAGVAWLLLAAVIFWAGRELFGLGLPQLQTLTFVTLVFSGYANVFLVRERRRVWASAPGWSLAIAACVGVVVVGLMAMGGVLMAPVPQGLVPALLGVVVVYLLVLDRLKVGIVRSLCLSL